MSTMHTLGIDKLTADERRQLVHDIWDSLRSDEEARGLTEAERALIDARLAARDANPGAGSTWADVKARLLGGTS